ncbi:MAG: hypothetical protein J7578_19520 [Chitinophagaceae bacterium]|nr:hypothetical protein [Chitinophagaceae bacterium]
MPEFLTYSKFHTKEETEEFAAFLDKNNIIFDIEQTTRTLDNVYIGEDPDPRFLVKVMPEQFDQVDKLMEERTQEELNHVNPSYYLFHFSNCELRDVLSDPEEWNYFDQLLAKKLLKERGEEEMKLPEPVMIHEMDTVKPSRLATGWVVAGYLMIPLMPFLSVIASVMLLFTNRPKKDGTKQYFYDGPTRAHALVILVLSVLYSLYLVFIRKGYGF